MDKFKRDDIVSRRGSRARVVKSFNNGKYLVFDLENNLDYVVDEENLQFWTEHLQNNSPKNVNYGKCCPRCNTPWTITGFGSSVWYDCKTCGKKAEDLLICKKESPIDPYDLEYIMDQLPGKRL
jgi:hypothetical protein